MVVLTIAEKGGKIWPSALPSNIERFEVVDLHAYSSERVCIEYSYTENGSPATFHISLRGTAKGIASN